MKTLWIIIVIVVLTLVVVGLQKVGKNEGPTEPIKIGALIPLTGIFANAGEDIRNGVEIAREELLRSGVNIEVVYEDSAADAKTALPAAQKLVNIDKVKLIIGGPGSSANLAVAPALNESQTPFLAISSGPRINDAGEYIFKVHPDIQGEVVRTVELLKARGVKKAAVIYDSASDSQTIGKDTFLENFANGGGTVLATEGYDSKSSPDFRSIFTKIKAKNPEAIYFLAGEKVAGPAVKQAREIGLAQPIFGWTSYEGEEFLRGAGPAGEGVIITGQPFSCDGNEAMKSFCKKYAEKYSGRVALQYSAHAYDLMNIFAGIVKEKGNLDSQNIATAFTSQTYHGISGELKFNDQGNAVDKDFVFRVVRDGKFVPLSQ